MVGASAQVLHRSVDVDGVQVFYRESRPKRTDAPVLLLLHGFPSGSHQFHRLIDVLGARYRLIAPDDPGSGYTETPDGFVYSFDRLADIVEGFLQRLGLDRFTMYVFDFGAPIGFRIAERHPEWVSGLIVQNGNAYEEGLGDALRRLVGMRPGTLGAEAAVNGFLTAAATRNQYETGVADVTVLDPDSWTLDQNFLDLPGRKEAQEALLFDYHSNVERYDRWQTWLRTHTPPTLIVWGRHDPFFTEAGALAYLNDLPHAELHLFDTGHFALETHLSRIAPLIGDFLDRA